MNRLPAEDPEESDEAVKHGKFAYTLLFHGSGTSDVSSDLPTPAKVFAEIKAAAVGGGEAVFPECAVDASAIFGVEITPDDDDEEEEPPPKKKPRKPRYGFG